MADNAGGVFLNTINGTPDIQVNEGIPNEKRVRDIALAVAESCLLYTSPSPRD